MMNVLKCRNAYVGTILFTVFGCFSMNEQRAINDPDKSLSAQQQKELIEKYSKTTWQQDLCYAKAILATFYDRESDFYKRLQEDQWREKRNELIEHGISEATIGDVKTEFFKHKCKIVKRVGNCYICLILTPSVVMVSRLMGLF